MYFIVKIDIPGMEGGGDRQTETVRQTDKQTDRQTDRQTQRDLPTSVAENATIDAREITPAQAPHLWP